MHREPSITRVLVGTAIAFCALSQQTNATTGETTPDTPPRSTVSERKIQLVEAVVDKVRSMAKLDDTIRSNDRLDIVESVIRKTRSLQTNVKYANKPEVVAFAEMIISALEELRSEGATSDSFVVDLFSGTSTEAPQSVRSTGNAGASTGAAFTGTASSGAVSATGTTATTVATASGPITGYTTATTTQTTYINPTTGITTVSTGASQNGNSTAGTTRSTSSRLDKWGYPEIGNLARGDELVSRTEHIALVTNNGVPGLKAVDGKWSVLRHMGTTPASVLKTLWNYDIPLSELEKVTLAGKNAGIAKFGQYDFYGLSKGGMGADFDWTQDKNLKSKWISGAKTLADNRVVAVRAKLKPASILQDPIPVYDYCGPDACTKITPKIIGQIFPAIDPTRVVSTNQ